MNTNQSSELEKDAQPRTPQEKEAMAQLKALRKKLLDLSKRNKLLNYKHSVRSRDHIRIVDEILEETFDRLTKGKKFGLKPLPEPNPSMLEPEDENTDLFHAYLREARGSEDYVRRSEKIGSSIDEDDDNYEEIVENELNALERKIRNEIREELGMLPLAKQANQSNASWAKQHGISSSYSLIGAGAELKSEHYDNYLQTLFLPEDLERKLESIHKISEESDRERGVSTLFAIFGFLEWFEADASDVSLYAPLLLLPLSILKDRKANGISFKIEATDDTPVVNETLAVRLKDENIVLPDFDEDKGVEHYFKCVSEAIFPKNKWRVRRYVTFGHLAFHKLSMHEDLVSDKWPPGWKPFQHKVVRELLGGRENPHNSDYREVYNPDSPEFASEAPDLVRDADSSQFSAVVDVMRGENLVIQGPPGTGKSQTIANIIGAAMGKGKTVLFVAEKQSALEVVKKRLDDDQIGNYCFELHSAKSTKAEVLKKIKDRISLKRRRVNGLRDRSEALKIAKDTLSDYLDLLKLTIGNTGITVEKALWLARKKNYSSLPDEFKTLRLGEISTATEEDFVTIKDNLKALQEAEGNLSDSPWLTPWNFVSKPHLSAVDLHDLRALITKALDQAQEIDEIVSNFVELTKIELPRSLKELYDFLLAFSAYPRLQCVEDYLLFDVLTDREGYKTCQELLNQEDELENLKKHFKERLSGFSWNQRLQALDNLNNTRKIIEEQSLNVGTVNNLHKIANDSTRLAEYYDEWEAKLNRISSIIGNSDNLFRVVTVDAASGLSEFESQMPISIEKYKLKSYATHQGSAELKGVLDNLDKLNRRIAETCQSSGMRIPEVPSRKINLYKDVISKAGVFGFLSSDYRAANKYVRCLYTSDNERSKLDILDDLSAVADALKSKEELLARQSIQDLNLDLNEPIETQISQVIDCIEWFEEIRKKLRDHGTLGEILLSYFETHESHDYKPLLNELLTIPSRPQLDFNFSRGVDETSLSDFATQLRQLSTTSRSVISALKSAGLGPGTEIRELWNIISKLEHAIQADKDLESMYKAIEAEYKVEPATDRLAEVKRSYDALSKFSYITNLVPVLSGRDGSDTIRMLYEFADSLEKLLCNYQTALDEFKKYSSAGGPVSFQSTYKSIKNCIDALHVKDHDLEAWANWLSAEDSILNSKASELCELLERKYNAHSILENFDLFVGLTLSDYVLEKHPDLRKHNGLKLTQAQNKIREIDGQLKQIARERIIDKIEEHSRNKPMGVGMGGKLEYTEYSLIRHLSGLTKMSGKMSTRRVIRQAGSALQHLMPCFMMSPLSVAQFIEPEGIKFDLVIFDEASQVLPEDAVGALLRGRQFVVVGDQMQLPPTSFFSSNAESSDEEEDLVVEESILEKAQTMFQPPRRLLWHYRSKHPSLIAYSNKEFYNGELHIFPSPVDPHPQMGVKLCSVNGEYVGRTNPIEADQIVEASIRFMKSHPDKSMGIVALNAVQRDLIERKLDRALSADRRATKYVKSWENTLEPLIIKNLETVQGDERDAIFISTVYGRSPGSDKAPAQRFGPIISSVGHRRLNVLFTRAKEAVYVYTSLRPEDILSDEKESWGKRVFREYLNYARSGILHAGDKTKQEPDSEFEIQVRDRLKARGYGCECQVGVAGYRIDLAVKHPRAHNHYILGVECDGARYHTFKSARDRDRLRQDVLEGLGWIIHRIWSTDWFNDPEAQMNALVNRIRKLETQIEPILFKHNVSTNEALDEIETARANAVSLPEMAIGTDEVEGGNLEETAQSDSNSLESDANTVQIGSRVKFAFTDELNMTVDVTIVTTKSRGNRVNFNTAVGKALMGHKPGEEATVVLPDGNRIAHIFSVQN